MSNCGCNECKSGKSCKSCAVGFAAKLNKQPNNLPPVVPAGAPAYYPCVNDKGQPGFGVPGGECITCGGGATSISHGGHWDCIPRAPDFSEDNAASVEAAYEYESLTVEWAPVNAPGVGDNWYVATVNTGAYGIGALNVSHELRLLSVSKLMDDGANDITNQITSVAISAELVVKDPDQPGSWKHVAERFVIGSRARITMTDGHCGCDKLDGLCVPAQAAEFILIKMDTAGLLLQSGVIELARPCWGTCCYADVPEQGNRTELPLNAGSVLPAPRTTPGEIVALP